MPEYPDITVYIEALEARILGQPLSALRIANPFLLRTVSPDPNSFLGQRIEKITRVGKRIAFGFEHGPWMVLHLMIAGRLHWKAKSGLASWDFPNGTLTLTEAGTKRQASLHLVDDYGPLDPGGLELFPATPPEFVARLRLRNHTLKRALTDPRLFSGIGNAYSDEILHHARLSPVALTQKLSDAEALRLFASIRSVLTEWTDRLRTESKGNFPANVTAFRPEMAAHGKYLQPCPVCGVKIQRIRYASNETDYCPQCQTGGKVLADRALSRLLGADWPRNIEELDKLGRA